ncbi:MAG: MarR family winged helix-turn-helix transcriptional regulator [Desulfobacterales bacterium]
MNEISTENKFSSGIPEHQLTRLSGLIEDVRRCCEDRLMLEARQMGLPCAEIRCLLLFGHERYLTVKGIAQRLDVAKSRVTKLVNSMNEKKLIERAEDPEDGRVRLLRLTPQGRRIVERIEDFQKTMQAKILEKLDPDERRRVISGLELLRSAMHEVKDEIKECGTKDGSGLKSTHGVNYV